MGVKKYIKRAIEIEALEWTGRNIEEIFSFMSEGSFSFTGEILYINTLEGPLKASEGDYIIKGLRGEYYPCKPDIFAQSYDEIVDDDVDKDTCLYIRNCTCYEEDYSSLLNCHNYRPDYYGLCRNLEVKKDEDYGYIREGYLGKH